MHPAATNQDLARAFLTAWRGATPDDSPALAAPDVDALQAAVADAHREGVAAWPALAVDAAEFAAYAAARAPADEATPAAAIARLRAADLYFACACARGTPAALRAFEERFSAKLPAYLAKLRASRELIEEAQQALRARLLVPTREAPARIAQYNGRGSLEGWVRVAAVRIATDLRDRERPHDIASDPAVFGALADEEMAFIERRYRGDFAACFKEALGQLEQRERNVLRLHYLERLTPERVAALFGVHRTTVARWLAGIEAQLLAKTRKLLSARLRISESECDSLIGLVRSRLNITLHSVLRATPP